MVKDMFSSVGRHAGLKKRPVLQGLVNDLFHRVEAMEIAHDLIAEFDWNPIPLSGLSIRLIQATLEAVLPNKEIAIDQSPIGRTPRSNPATYIGAFTPIRELYANTELSKAKPVQAITRS